LDPPRLARTGGGAPSLVLVEGDNNFARQPCSRQVSVALRRATVATASVALRSGSELVACRACRCGAIRRRRANAAAGVVADSSTEVGGVLRPTSLAALLLHAELGGGGSWASRRRQDGSGGGETDWHRSNHVVVIYQGKPQLRDNLFGGWGKAGWVWRGPPAAGRFPAQRRPRSNQAGTPVHRPLAADRCVQPSLAVVFVPPQFPTCNGQDHGTIIHEPLHATPRVSPIRHVIPRPRPPAPRRGCRGFAPNGVLGGEPDRSLAGGARARTWSHRYYQ